MKSYQKILQIHPNDNILVALTDLKKGDQISFEDRLFVLQNDIAAKHKFAMCDFAKGASIFMYGVLVGKATKEIFKGGLISTSNIVHDTEAYSVEKVAKKTPWVAPDLSKFKNKTFKGYPRANGSVGTENNWLIIPLVFCQNRNVEVLKETLVEKLGFGKKRHLEFNVEKLINAYKAGDSSISILEKNIIEEPDELTKNPLFPNVDGVRFLTHNGGCGGAASDAISLCNLLAGYINNSNVAGATVLSLGCQNAQASILEKCISKNGTQ